MRFKIYKYELVPDPKTGIVEVEMPIESTVLSVHQQDGGIFLWARVKVDGLMTKYKFLVAVTGHEIYDDKDFVQFIGTVHIPVKDNQPFLPNLVFHIFQVKAY
jgi:hypothetical protein